MWGKQEKFLQRILEKAASEQVVSRFVSGSSSQLAGSRNCYESKTEWGRDMHSSAKGHRDHLLALLVSSDCRKG